MPLDAAELRSIKSFDQLVSLLCDHLDWPDEVREFEDSTFPYDPEEFGLKLDQAANVTVHQLRPVRRDQPWGIFFIEFSSKKMPVVVLRRILNRLVRKKRQTADAASRAVWDLNDLLFITAFGGQSGTEREIAFAHFHQERGDLPTLRVLGWDGGNTVPKLDYVAGILKERLSWPEDDGDLDAWRRQWSGAFKHRIGHSIRTADELAKVLARLAKRIRDAATVMMEHEAENGPLRQLHKAFQTALIHDLSEADFADTYAQTVTYGLLTAALSRTDMNGGTGTVLLAENLAEMVPVTNPFLKEMLQTFLTVGGRENGIDFDELGTQDVIDLLRDPKTDLPMVVRDFGNRTQREDTVVYFYEHFLKEYDKELKFQRGVFYTPQPVVSFIVRSVHELLQSEFGLVDGVASIATWREVATAKPTIKIPEGTDPDSHFVTILDPATGTATFLVESIDLIHRTMMAKWKAQGMSKPQQTAAWNEYVPQHLLPRLYGYELMMAPYAIAHMRLGLKLIETKYNFGSEARARVYLSNALEPARDYSGMLDFAAPALAHEAQAVNKIKSSAKFFVVIGNPPYAQYSMNLNADAKTHIEKFRYANGQRIKARNALQLERNLNDDYVKFVGFSVDSLNIGGIACLVTNRMYINSSSLVGMREWINRNFRKSIILDLWGSSEEARRIERLHKDENVFDIMQGVAIMSLLGRGAHTIPSASYMEIIGSRDSKYAFLDNSTASTMPAAEVRPGPSDWYFHQDPKQRDPEMTLDQIFLSYSTLVASNRDHLVVGFETPEVLKNMRQVRDYEGTDKEVSENFSFTLKKNWNIKEARRALKTDNLEKYVRDIEYRPFDRRKIFFHPSWVWQTAPAVSRNAGATQGNLILISLGKNRSEANNGHWISTILADKSVVSTRDNASGFPLYVMPGNGQLQLSTRECNFTQAFLRNIASTLSLNVPPDGSVPKELTIEQIFTYIYAILLAPGYRNFYAAKLCDGFPPIPIAEDLELFKSVAELGATLVKTHTLCRDFTSTPNYFGRPDVMVAAPTWDGQKVYIDSAGISGFGPFDEIIWSFQVGSFHPAQRWLKERKGRKLSPEDIEHYRKILAAISETIRLQAAIDKVIEEHGGWAGAFVGKI